MTTDKPDSAKPESANPSMKPMMRQQNRLLWPLVALGLLLLFNLVFTKDFFSITVRDGRLFGSIIDILNRGAPTMLLALGMTLVIATGGVDLSVGAVMAMTGAVAAMLILRGVALPGVIAGGLALALISGLWNGVLVSLVGLQPIVATLILMVAGRGIAQLLTDGQILTFSNPPFEFIANGSFLGLPFPVTIVAVFGLLTWFFTRRTSLALFIESVGANETASRYAGVEARAVKLFAYVFSGLCAGVAGLIAVSNIKAADSNNAGLYLEMDAILAAVIGGTALTGGRFNLIGSILGAVIVQALNTTILARGVAVELTLVVKALVVLAVCLLQSEEFRRALLRRKEVA